MSFFFPLLTALALLTVLTNPASAAATTKKPAATTTKKPAGAAAAVTTKGNAEITTSTIAAGAEQTTTTVSGVENGVALGQEGIGIIDTTTTTVGVGGIETTSTTTVPPAIGMGLDLGVTSTTTTAATLTTGQTVKAQPAITPIAGPTLVPTTCANQPEGAIFAHPTDCHYFYQCQFWVMYLVKCSTDMAFNKLTKMCDITANVPGC
uniref:Chitin-binding type-2 domain-containing protein n=1 Tax=Plectus sambesii TaxID=2011161 RepID=A0A914VBX9_9BILA